MNKDRIKLSAFIEAIYEQLEPFNTSPVKCELKLGDFDFDLDDIEARYGKDVFLMPPTINDEKVEFEININYMRRSYADRD